MDLKSGFRLFVRPGNSKRVKSTNFTRLLITISAEIVLPSVCSLIKQKKYFISRQEIVAGSDEIKGSDLVKFFKYRQFLLTIPNIVSCSGLSLKNGCPDQRAEEKKYAGNPQQSYKSRVAPVEKIVDAWISLQKE